MKKNIFYLIPGSLLFLLITSYKDFEHAKAFSTYKNFSEYHNSYKCNAGGYYFFPVFHQWWSFIQHFSQALMGEQLR